MLIAEYDVDSPLLAETFESVSGLEVRTEEHYVDDGTVHWQVWVRCDDWEAFERAVREDPTVTEPLRLAAADGRRLYRLLLTPEGEAGTTYLEWPELGLTLLDGRGTADGWTGRMRVPDRDRLNRFLDAMDEQGISYRITALYRRTEDDPGREPTTSRQREALERAYEAGYFDVPRSVTQAELAAELGISTQSLSERLRRGTAALIEDTVR